jgi:ketosteroid isomerase-like protein
VATTAEAWGAEVYVKPFGLVATIENGQVVRMQEYFDHAEALAAVGL